VLELLNVQFVFFSSHKPSKRKQAISHRIRIIFQGERPDMLTGLYCAEKDWDRGERGLKALMKDPRP